MTKKPQKNNSDKESVDGRIRDNSLFFDVFSKINVGSLLYDPERDVIMAVNDAFLRLTGFAQDEVVGHNIRSSVLFREIFSDPATAARLQEGVSDLRTRFRTASGEEKVVLVSALPLPVKDPSPQILITLRDITKEVKALSVQDYLNMRYHSIINHIDTGVVIYRVDEKKERFFLIDLNNAMEMMENLQREEVIGKELRELFPAAEKYDLIPRMLEVYRTGRYAFLSITFRDEQGKKRWRDIFIHKLADDELLLTYNDRTSEKLYQKEIKESEKRYRDLADLLPVAIFETNLSGIITYANKMALEIFRYSREDLNNGLSVIRMIVPEQRLQARHEIYRQVRSPEIPGKPKEFTGLRKDGTTFPLSFTVSPIIKGDEIQGLRGILNDLTEEKKIQEQLKRDKIYLESLIQGAPEAILQTYKDGTVLRINKEFTHLFGFREEEVLGELVSDFLYGDDAKVREQGLRMIREIARGNPQNVETIRYHKNGTPIPVSFLGSPIIIDGKIVGVFGIYRDISQRKRNERVTETILNISTAALTTSTLNEFFDVIRKELSSILNTRNLFIALYNKEKDTLHFPLHLDEKDGSEVFQEVSARRTLSGYVIRKRKPVLFREEEMIRLEKKGEFNMIGTPSRIWLGVPLEVDGEIIGIISIQDYDNKNAFSHNDLNILRIVSNQIALAIKHKQAQELLRVAKERAEENARFKEQFLSTMSHEIRTPLNAIIGMTRLLANTNPSPDQQDYIHAIEISGNNLMRLINDILDYSKLEAGKMVIEEISFDPVAQLEGLTRSYQYMAKEKGLALIVEIDPSLPREVRGDPTRINQILTNLIGNAIKFTLQGEIRVSLRLQKETKETVTLSYAVSDTGIGIPKEKLETIFESFTQAEKATTRKFGGTGLGLSISKKLAELLGTTIHVESKVNRGTTFSFSLTLKKGKGEAQDSDNDLQKVFADLRNKRVLIAEDNALNRIVAIKSMREWGMEIDQCENGQEAVEMVKKNDYDVILMDLQMPVMDGYEATRAIRNLPDPRKKEIPIIALTASALMDIRSQAREYAMDDILIKPFQPDDLARILHGLIMKKNKEKE